MPKILLAEDDPTMVSLLKTFLKMEGFDTIILGEQEDILVAIHREKPDIVLLDVHLTQGDGVDFLRKIRSDPDAMNIFVIMQSGMDLMEECNSAGANAFLLKPYLPDFLVKTIKSGLARQQT